MTAGIALILDMKTVEEWKAILRSKLREAMGARQKHVVAVLRETLAALDNAEAPPLNSIRPASEGVFAGSVEGVGAGEVSRLLLEPEAVSSLVRREIQERKDAAHEYSKLGKMEEAGILLEQAGVLEALDQESG